MKTAQTTWMETNRPTGVTTADWTAYLWTIAGQGMEVRKARAAETGYPLVPADILA